MDHRRTIMLSDFRCIASAVHSPLFRSGNHGSNSSLALPNRSLSEFLFPEQVHRLDLPSISKLGEMFTSVFFFFLMGR